ncbi:MAG: DUF2726 domain-containing protein [Planctomycetia bacterium]|nr:DUF2726 domain-containing protein [Planctomycetia bacterium]
MTFNTFFIIMVVVVLVEFALTVHFIMRFQRGFFSDATRRRYSQREENDAAADDFDVHDDPRASAAARNARTNLDDLSAHAFRKRDFLSPNELKFIQALWRALGDRYYVAAKVGLWSVVQNVERSDWYRISQKHLDFLLCDPATMQAILAIELDDASHNTASARRRDQQKDTILRNAGVPVLRIRSAMEYDETILLQLLERALRDATAMP